MYIEHYYLNMQTQTISATKARQEFFDLLTWVSKGKSFLVERDKVLVANINPIYKKSKNKGLLKALDLASVGFTYSKRGNPLRRKGSDSFLGNWDK